MPVCPACGQPLPIVPDQEPEPVLPAQQDQGPLVGRRPCQACRREIAYGEDYYQLDPRKAEYVHVACYRKQGAA